MPADIELSNEDGAKSGDRRASATVPDDHSHRIGEFLIAHGGPFYDLQLRLNLLHRHTLAAGRRALLFAAIARPLGPLKRQAVLDYRALASRHDRAFEARWLHGGGNDAGPPGRAGHLRACRPRGRLRSGAPHNALAVVEGERSAPRAGSE